MTTTFGACKTCGHSQIVHFMSRGECVLRGITGKCSCKIFTPPTPSEKEQ